MTIIDPRGNKDSETEKILTGCYTSPPSGVRVHISVLFRRGCDLTSGDVNSLLLQTRKVEREVYSITQYKIKDKKILLWLLNFELYGMVNSNADLQEASEKMLIDLILSQVTFIPPIFPKKEITWSFSKN